MLLVFIIGCCVRIVFSLYLCRLDFYYQWDVNVMFRLYAFYSFARARVCVGTFLMGKLILFKVAFSTELIHDIVSFSKVSVY